MNLWISKEFFTPPLPADFFQAYFRLKDAGHTIGFDKITDDQIQEVLISQNITTDFSVQDEAHAKLERDETSFSISAKESDKPRFYDSFLNLATKERFALRTASVTRKTNETDISVEVDLDGEGKSNISTGLGFFDHMLDQIAKHGFIDLNLSCKGDLHIDEHHTIEDVAIALGEAIGKAMPDKKGIGRYGFILAMDEAQARVALDLSNRPYLVFDANFSRDKVGDFPTEMTEHFFYSLTMSLKATLQMSVSGDNDHHKIESLFKGFARCLRQALDRNEKYLNVLPSSKGKL